MLDEVIVGLGYSADYDEEEDIKEKENKKDLKNQIKQTILEQIEKGQMTVNEALEALKKNK